MKVIDPDTGAVYYVASNGEFYRRENGEQVWVSTGGPLHARLATAKVATYGGPLTVTR